MIDNDDDPWDMGLIESKSKDVTYQALTGGIVWAVTSSSTVQSISIKVDAFTPPTTTRNNCGTIDSGESCNVIAFVRPGEYYKITGTSLSTLRFIPFQ